VGLALCICGTLGKGTLRTYPSFRVPTLTTQLNEMESKLAKLTPKVGGPSLPKTINTLKELNEIFLMVYGLPK
jgi:hypothetical protein